MYYYNYNSSYWIGYAIGSLIFCIICGCITRSMNQNKGYTGGFAWGFWLTIIGIIVVAVKPNAPSQSNYQSSADYYRSSSNYYHTPEHESNSVTCSFCGTQNSAQSDYCSSCGKSLKRTIGLGTASGDNGQPSWECVCGAVNGGSWKYCPSCNRTKAEAMKLKEEAAAQVNEPEQQAEPQIEIQAEPQIEQEPIESTPTIPASVAAEATKVTLTKASKPAVERDLKNPDEITKLLETLADLKNRGILTEEEFKAKKQEILARI